MSYNLRGREDRHCVRIVCGGSRRLNNLRERIAEGANDKGQRIYVDNGIALSAIDVATTELALGEFGLDIVVDAPERVNGSKRRRPLTCESCEMPLLELCRQIMAAGPLRLKRGIKREKRMCDQPPEDADASHRQRALGRTSERQSLVGSTRGSSAALTPREQCSRGQAEHRAPVRDAEPTPRAHRLGAYDAARTREQRPRSPRRCGTRAGSGLQTWQTAESRHDALNCDVK